ncbi:sialate O-acetylesterase isoform X2 [Rhea pennata]|uniref:sialate O-acetylesterase isoform X2 n=1 Tax=Rhea pennata TaxID=8795 RepID=UPI002E274138
MAVVPVMCLLLLAGAAGATLRFASYYTDHMVLQKEPAGAVVWGYGQPGAAVALSLARDGAVVMKKMAQVKEPSGTWKVILDPMAHGGPYALMAEQRSENLTLQDIYFGDVWLCSGQSNMAMTVLQVVNASKELAAAARYPYVRVFATAPARSDTELEDLVRVDVPWSVPTAGILGHGNFTYFSALCWLFGRYLYETLRYPVGLLESAWGGTPIEAWSSPRALRACGLQEDAARFSPHEHLSGPQAPSVLWNAMIHPLLNVTLRGIAWYQGEANAFVHTDLYNCTFPALVADWRQAFHAGSAGQTEPLLPFGFVQSPDDGFARLRWHQTADVGFAPNPRMPRTFMAVAADLGDERSPYGSIHPRDKQSVARRLLLGARAVAYGEKGLVFQGPYPTRATGDATGDLLNVTYNQELVWHRRVERAFEVCCSSQLPLAPCQWVPAPVVAVESRRVTLTLAGCGAPALGLRYAWAEWPCEYQACALYNGQGLPAPPFRTDALPGSREPFSTSLHLPLVFPGGM